MIREIKTFEIECSDCHSKETFHGTKYDKPSGWGVVTVGPCGMTDYYRGEDLCPDCMEKHAKSLPLKC
jgi:hypothetical protein